MSTTTFPSVSSSSSTATDASISEASPSSTQNPYNSGGNSPTHTLTTVMPAFLIAFICVFSLFLACGVFYGRRRRLMLLRHMPSVHGPAPLLFAPPPPRSRKKKRLARPKLWEVDAKEAHWAWVPDLEALEPVAVELQAVPTTKAASSHGQKRSNNWHVPGLSRSHKPQECDHAPTRRAQVTVLLAMPSLEHAAGYPSREYVIGTTSLPYRTPEPEEEEEEDPEIRHMKLRLALCEAVLD